MGNSPSLSEGVSPKIASYFANVTPRPERSELRRYLPNYPYLCDMNDLADTKSKLYEVLTSEELHNSEAKEIFSDASFKSALDNILN